MIAELIISEVRVVKMKIEDKLNRPDIEVLTDFSKTYLSNLTVKWKEMEPLGEAYLEDNTIFLNPIIPIERECLGLGYGMSRIYENELKDLKLESGEQYFLILLHEIGHFKVAYKPPKEFIRIKERLEKEYPNNIETQVYNSANYLKQRKNESDEELQGRLLALESYIANQSVVNHLDVDNWGIREFRKNRKRIRKLLAIYSLELE